MNHGKKLGLLGCVFLGLFLFLSLPSAQSAEEAGNAPVVVASQEATIPLAANAVTGTAEAESPYKLHLRLAAVALHRLDGNRNQRLLSAQVKDSEAHVNSRDIQAEWAAGIDSSIMLQVKNFGVELRYLGTPKGWTASAYDREMKDGKPFHDDALAKARYDSWLQNGEFNLHWWPCPDERYNLLAGFRWMGVSERVKGLEWEIKKNQEDFFEDKDTAKTRNQLWGAQVGVEGLLFGKRDQGFSIDGVVKAGFLHNNIHDRWVSEHDRDNDGNFIVNDSYSRNRSKNAALGELGINANYAFTKNIALTCGYQLIYLSHLSYVAQEFDTQSAIFQGGRLGFNVVF